MQQSQFIEGDGPQRRKGSKIQTAFNETKGVDKDGYQPLEEHFDDEQDQDIELTP